jgi:hypothetical protein
MARFSKTHEVNPMDFKPPIEWTKGLHPIGPNENPKSRLFGTVRILDQLFHVNAEQVVKQDVGVDGFLDQVGVLDNEETYVDEIQTLVQGSGQTVHIEERDYLLVICPYEE